MAEPLSFSALRRVCGGTADTMRPQSQVSRHPSFEQPHFLTGLIGAPIKHSASPAMHEQAADALGVRCHYQLIEVAGADRVQLRALLDGVRRFGFSGVNVTFPYKEAVVEL